MDAVRRIALVTGAGSGIGAAIARRFARDGVTVICADIRVGAAEVVAAGIRETGGAAEALDLDIADDDAIAGVPIWLREHFGGLDVLVNNAGVGGEVSTALLDIAAVRRVLAINVEGAISLTLAVRPMLALSSAPRILNIASIQGFRGAKDSLAYGASKGALVNVTRGLAVDLADDGVLVNALAPGFVDTPMALLGDGSSEYDTDWFRGIYVENARIPLRRPGSAQEVAEAAVFFCSPANGYVTGQILAVDGGMTATF
jgi:NAD(P)-dependent dehydrogenase (short-subunit alcohol dehydrogenase family)